MCFLCYFSLFGFDLWSCRYEYTTKLNYTPHHFTPSHCIARRPDHRESTDCLDFTTLLWSLGLTLFCGCRNLMVFLLGCGCEFIDWQTVGGHSDIDVNKVEFWKSDSFSNLQLHFVGKKNIDIDRIFLEGSPFVTVYFDSRLDRHKPRVNTKLYFVIL